MSWSTVGEIAAGIVPTAALTVLFVLVIRALLRADSGERAAHRQFGAPGAGDTVDASGPSPAAADGAGGADKTADNRDGTGQHPD